VVELQLMGGGNLNVNQIGIEPIPTGALAGGVVSNLNAVAAAIHDLFQKTKISSKRVVVAISGQAVIIRHIKIPMMGDAEMAQAIKWEAERYIPFAIDEVSLRSQVIQRDPGQNEMEVMIVCAHNDIIDSHMETLKQVGVMPQAMDIQPFALMRAFGLEGESGLENIALLDIGAGTSDLTIVKTGVPRFTRIIPVAGARFTQIISSSLGISFEEAEKAKIELSDALYEPGQSPADSLEHRVNIAIMEGFKELAMELRRSFDYYQLQQRHEGISKLMISGGGSKIKNLLPYFKSQLNMPVEIGKPTGRILCPERLRSGFEAYLPNLTVAFGLALREVTPG
jgi:type IV pilus assembly protein PilM